MKKALVAVIVAALIGATGFLAVGQDENVPTSAPFFFFGSRLHTDASFYVQGGIKMDTFDCTVGIGFNNSVWLGAHGYFLTGGDLSASVFAGGELHVDNSGPAMVLDPAFSIGVAVNEGPILFIIDALIVPVSEGEPVNSVVALSFNFGWTVGGE